MKKTPTLTAAVACSLAALAPFAVLATAASDMDSTQPTLVIKDSSITSSIKAQLASDSFKGLSHIDVDTDHHGVVTLKGKVPARRCRSRNFDRTRDRRGTHGEERAEG